MRNDVVLFISLAIILVIALVCFVVVLQNDINLMYDWRIYKKFQRSLKSILINFHNTKDYEQCIFELEILYKNVVLSNSYLKCKYTGVCDIIEQYIASINCRKSYPAVDDFNIFRGEIRKLLAEYKEKNIFDQSSDENEIALALCMQCFENGDTEKGKEAIKRLTISMLKKIDFEKEKNSKKQISIAVVSNIITVISICATVYAMVVSYI